MEASTEAKPRVCIWDNYRIIGNFAVVFVHMERLNYTKVASPALYNYLNCAIETFVMPMFAFVSGVFVRSRGERLGKPSAAACAKKGASRRMQRPPELVPTPTDPYRSLRAP